MSKRHTPCDDSLRCSFCHEPQGVGRKLISSPSDYPRAYICDECIAVCQSILEDDRPEDDRPEPEQTQDHPLLSHPLASDLMTAVENWIRDEAVGADAAVAFADVRRIAMQMFAR